MIKYDKIIKDMLEKVGIENLRPIQKQSVPFIFGKKPRNLLIVAPSASGKTLIGELALMNAALNGMKGFYLVPLKSIANEKFIDFFKKYSANISIAITTGDFDISMEELEKKQIIITTYERFDSIIRKKPSWFKRIFVVVIDEIHNIGDRTRGIKLESLLTRLMTYNQIQIIGLSATIKNPEDLASWLNAELIINKERPAELRYKILISENKYETLKNLIPKLVEKKAQILIFTRTRKESEKLAKNLSKIVKKYLTFDEFQELDSFSKNIMESSLDFQTITGGVGYHHAGLDHNSRILVEKLFNNSLIKVICCTTTLSSGINTPANIVIIKDFKMYNNISNRPELLDKNKFHQISGRAGRFEKNIGFAIIMVSNEEEANKVKEYYFKEINLNNDKYHKKSVLKAKYENIFSSLPENRYALIDQTLVFIHHHAEGITRNDLIRFFKKTFFYFQLKSHGNEDYLIERLAFDKKNIEAVLRAHLVNPNNIIPAEVKAIHILEDRFEGIVITNHEKIDRICSFSNNSRYCTCSTFKNTGFCIHLYHLAIAALKKYRISSEDIILSSFNENFILDYLLNNNLIYIENERFKCTEYGNLIVNLFIDSRMFLFIRNRLKFTTCTYDFLDLIKKLTELKFEKSLSYHYLSVLNELINTDENIDINKFLKKMSTSEIGIGDLESFIEACRWVTNVIIKVAENTIEGNEKIINIGKMVLDKINRPLPDEEMMYKIVQSSMGSNIGIIKSNDEDMKRIFCKKVKYFLVLHKISGVPIYSYNFSLNDLDSSLISGYLTAISSFGLEISGGIQTNVKKMEYDKMKILIQEGENIRATIILEEGYDEWVLERLKIFIENVENKFTNLQNWNGDLNMFRNIGKMFNEVFGYNLIEDPPNI
ncbi:MAG: DEAD/DEAH box helicase [Candidatus Helarchaeota archaeon]